ncbi:neo-calmodulin-like [Bolinopsis microptera]|uniref:neo-calmodulin-like n=1 Tax=Bolinopsis microptera TaxID=2820187 RepID=UPI00307A3403
MNYEAIFKAFDKDRDGFLCGKELGKCMKKALGGRYNKDDLKFIISCADKDLNGRMDAEEFRVAVTVLKKVKLAELKELREVFTRFDLDGNGTICSSEFEKCMEKLGQALSPEECKEMINDADKDGDGLISYLEFALMVKEAEERHEMMGDEESLKEAFKMFDENGDGHIDKEELKQVLATVNPDQTLSDKELEDMFKLADLNGDGKITFDEFQILINA